MTFEERVEISRVWLISTEGCTTKVCRYTEIHRAEWHAAVTYIGGDHIEFMRWWRKSLYARSRSHIHDSGRRVHLVRMSTLEPDIYLAMKAMGLSQDDAFSIAIGVDHNDI